MTNDAFEYLRDLGRYASSFSYQAHRAAPASPPDGTGRLYNRAEVDVFIGEALRRVVWTFGHWNLEHCVEHVRKVAEDLGVEIPDE